MNTTIANLTVRSMLGRRRALWLLVLPGLMLVVAVLVRLLVGVDDQLAQLLMNGLAVVAVVPLLGVVAGTGAIGPEIEDGSIVYVLSKPIARSQVALTKFVVAAAVVVVLGAVPTLVSGWLVAGFGSLAAGYAAAAAAAGVAYAAIFFALAVLSRNAVVIGLIYALLWEAVVGTFVPGARNASVQQWSLAIAAKICEPGSVSSAVGFGTGVTMLVVVTVVGVGLSVWKLRRFTLASAE